MAGEIHIGDMITPEIADEEVALLRMLRELPLGRFLVSSDSIFKKLPRTPLIDAPEEAPLFSIDNVHFRNIAERNEAGVLVPNTDYPTIAIKSLTSIYAVREYTRSNRINADPNMPDTFTPIGIFKRHPQAAELFTEYMKVDSCDRVLWSTTQPQETAIQKALTVAADTLAQLTSNGWVHTDFTPANTGTNAENGQIMIIDPTHMEYRADKPTGENGLLEGALGDVARYLWFTRSFDMTNSYATPEQVTEYFLNPYATATIAAIPLSLRDVFRRAIELQKSHVKSTMQHGTIPTYNQL